MGIVDQSLIQCLRRRITNTTTSKLANTNSRMFSGCSRLASAMRLSRDGRPPPCALFSRWFSGLGPFHIETIQRPIDLNVSESADNRIQSGSQSCVPLWPPSFSPSCQRLANRPPEARFRYNLAQSDNNRQGDDNQHAPSVEHPYINLKAVGISPPQQCRLPPKPIGLIRLKDPCHTKLFVNPYNPILYNMSVTCLLT